MRVSECVWVCVCVDWMAVRRRYNEAADQEPSQAALRAAQLKTEGITSPEYSSS